MGWMATTTLKFNFRVGRYGESRDILEDLLGRAERGPRLKVPGSQVSPASAGPKNGQDINPAVAAKNRDTCEQAEGRAKRRDAAVGGTPVVRVDVSVQTPYASQDPPAILAERGSQTV